MEIQRRVLQHSPTNYQYYIKPGKLAKRYQEGEFVGAGDEGAVSAFKKYTLGPESQWLESTKQRVIKRYHDFHSASERNETGILAQLRQANPSRGEIHPNVMAGKVVEIQDHDTTSAVIMPRWPTTLTELNPESKPLSTRINVASQVKNGLGFLHRNNIAHMDIKGPNVLYNSDTDKVKICDFGQSKKIPWSDPEKVQLLLRADKERTITLFRSFFTPSELTLPEVESVVRTWQE